jgi:hypothetical protein
MICVWNSSSAASMSINFWTFAHASPPPEILQSRSCMQSPTIVPGDVLLQLHPPHPGFLDTAKRPNPAARLRGQGEEGGYIRPLFNRRCQGLALDYGLATATALRLSAFDSTILSCIFIGPRTSRTSTTAGKDAMVRESLALRPPTHQSQDLHRTSVNHQLQRSGSASGI